MANRNCLFCDGELGEIMFSGVRDRLGVSDKEWTFVRCRRCGSAILDPMPTVEDMLEAYPEIYSVVQAPQANWLHRLFYWLETELFYHPLYRHSVKQVIQVTGLRAGRLLDVGGGTGHRTIFFQKAGFDCTVLDIDERALKVAHEKFGLKIIHGTLEEANLLPGSFDLVTFFYVVEHLPDPMRTLQKAAYLIRPGGWVVVLVPLADSLAAKWLKSRWLEARDAPRHVGLPTHMGMRRLFAKCGLDFKSWTRNTFLSEAGIFALSLFPFAAVTCACNTSTIARIFRRSVGAAAMFGFLPLAWVVCWLNRPNFGFFFGQKRSEAL